MSRADPDFLLRWFAKNLPDTHAAQILEDRKKRRERGEDPEYDPWKGLPPEPEGPQGPEPEDYNVLAKGIYAGLLRSIPRPTYLRFNQHTRKILADMKVDPEEVDWPRLVRALDRNRFTRRPQGAGPDTRSRVIVYMGDEPESRETTGGQEFLEAGGQEGPSVIIEIKPGEEPIPPAAPEESAEKEVESLEENKMTTKEKVHELVDGGNSPREIAVKLGITPQAVYYYLKPPSPKSGNKKTVQRMNPEKVLEGLKEGLSLRQIARKYGRKRESVNAHLTKLRKEGLIEYRDLSWHVLEEGSRMQEDYPGTGNEETEASGLPEISGPLSGIMPLLQKEDGTIRLTLKVTEENREIRRELRKSIAATLGEVQAVYNLQVTEDHQYMHVKAEFFGASGEPQEAGVGQ